MADRTKRPAKSFVGFYTAPSFKRRLKLTAKANGRSMNQEIIWRLEHSFNGAKS